MVCFKIRIVYEYTIVHSIIAYMHTKRKTQNMKYLLKEQEVTNSFPIGISNEFILGKKGKVTVHKGAVVMIVSWV